MGALFEPAVWKGLVQGTEGASSTEQRKVAAGKGRVSRLASKEKLGRSSSVRAPSAGPEVIVVSRTGVATAAAGGRGEPERGEHGEHREDWHLGEIGRLHRIL